MEKDTFVDKIDLASSMMKVKMANNVDKTKKRFSNLIFHDF